MKLYIRDISTAESRTAVEEILTLLGIAHLPSRHGEVEIPGTVSEANMARIREALGKANMAVIEDKRNQLIEKIKSSVFEMVLNTDKPLRTNFSIYLSTRLMYDYTYLANLFSSVQGITIEHFIIHHKIEKVKELLTLGQFTLTEISYKLHYSSVAHLSNQFKKVTGFTPSYFKRLGNKHWLLPENV
jgi:YesN/AraC family two-component response regulator